MVDKSWGQPPTRSTPVAPRSEPLTARLDARAAVRAAQTEAREAARREGRAADAALKARDPHAAAAQRRRGSGRRDVVREDRDTSGYRLVADHAHIVALAARGASAESLAEVLGLSIEEIRQALAER